mmetsp:Transcript_70992/g.160668  ORF Transcript_70992/g.160668 Transcript_70992/m.160668 type:complete len:276 (-) Transcript_70992:80-907(-)
MKIIGALCLLFHGLEGGAFNPAVTRSLAISRVSQEPSLKRLGQPLATNSLLTQNGRAVLSPMGRAVVQGWIGSSCRIVVASSVAAALIIRRDAPTFLWVVGGVLNAALSKVLKRVINEARPEGARTADPGMPSSHSMSLFFLACFCACAALSWQPEPASLLAAVHRPRVEAAALIGYAVVGSSWRIGAGYHTAAQVGVGSALGACTGIGWFYACQTWLWDATARLFPGGKAPLGATICLLTLGAAAVGSVERKIKSWYLRVSRGSSTSGAETQAK